MGLRIKSMNGVESNLFNEAPLLALLAFLCSACFCCHAPSSAQEAQACKPADAASAFRAGDLERLTTAYESAKRSGARCEDNAAYCIGRLVAVVYRDRTIAAAKDERMDVLQSLLDKAKAYGAPWHLLAARGDIDFSRGIDGDKAAYAEAATSYERALNDLAEGTPCGAYGEPGAPPVDQIASLVKRAQEAKLLSPTFEVERTRSGECGGIFLAKIRDFRPRKRPLPIEFETDSIVFTAKGQRAAEGLSDCLGRAGASHIHLTGHADARGTDAYNMTLSARRLDAVKGFLVDRGFSGSIELEPQGKRKPWKPESDRFSPEDVLQMNRRVELEDAAR